MKRKKAKEIQRRQPKRIVFPSDEESVRLRREGAESAAGKTAILTPEQKDLLLRLQAMGLLTLSPDIATLHSTEGYTPIRGGIAKAPDLRYDAARRIWKTAIADDIQRALLGSRQPAMTT